MKRREEIIRQQLLNILQRKFPKLLIIPEADRWDLVIIGYKRAKAIPIAGIELKAQIRKTQVARVKTWYAHNKSKYRIVQKQKFKIGTVLKVGANIWLAQNDGGFSQAIRQYQHSTIKPQKVLILEVDEVNRKFRITDTSKWTKKPYNTGHTNQVQVIKNGSVYNADIYEPNIQLPIILTFTDYRDIAKAIKKFL